MSLLQIVVFIALQGFTRALKSIPAVEGSSVQFDCTKDGSGIGAQVLWRRRNKNRDILAINENIQSQQLAVKYSVEVKRQNNEKFYSLTIKKISLADSGEYECFLLRSSNDNHIEIFELNVLIPPHKVRVTSPTGTLVEDDEVTVTCDADGGKPLPILTWRKIATNGTVTDLGEGKLTDVKHENLTGNRKSMLKLSVDRTFLTARLVCDVYMPFIFSEERSIVFVLKVRPLRPIITGLTADTGQPVELTCVASQADPQATITWYDYANSKAISARTNQVTPNDDGTFDTTSKVLLFRSVGAENDGEMVGCRAINQVLTDKKEGRIETKKPLNINRKPTMSVPNSTMTAMEKQDISLRVQIDVNPPDSINKITWYKDGLPLTINRSARYQIGNGLDPYLTIVGVRNTDKGLYNLEVENRLGSAISGKILLNVLHAPLCRVGQKRKYGAELGSSVDLHCDLEANPNDVVMQWYDSNTLVQSHLGVRYADDIYRVTGVLRRTPRRPSDYKAYECRGNNTLGVQSEPCKIQLVEPAPSEAPFNCRQINRTASSVAVECDEGFDGGYPQRFVIQQKMDSGYINKDNKTVSAFFVSSLYPGTTYTFRMCSSNSKFWQMVTCSQEFFAKTVDTGALPPVSQSRAGGVREQDIPWIVVGTVGSFVLLIAVIGAVYYWKCRSSSKMNVSGGSKVRLDDVEAKGDAEVCYDNIASDSDDVVLNLTLKKALPDSSAPEDNSAMSNSRPTEANPGSPPTYSEVKKVKNTSMEMTPPKKPKRSVDLVIPEETIEDIREDSEGDGVRFKQQLAALAAAAAANVAARSAQGVEVNGVSVDSDYIKMVGVIKADVHSSPDSSEGSNELDILDEENLSETHHANSENSFCKNDVSVGIMAVENDAVDVVEKDELKSDDTREFSTTVENEENGSCVENNAEEEKSRSGSPAVESVTELENPAEVINAADDFVDYVSSVSRSSDTISEGDTSLDLDSVGDGESLSLDNEGLLEEDLYDTVEDHVQDDTGTVQTIFEFTV